MSALTVGDQLALHDLIARSSQAIDFSNPDAYADVFAEDGVLIGQEAERRGGAVKYRCQGRGELRQFAADAAAKRQGFGRHWINSTVLRADGDGAAGVSYLFFLTIDPATVACDIMVSAVHHDQFTKTPEGWKLAERKVVYDG